MRKLLTCRRRTIPICTLVFCGSTLWSQSDVRQQLDRAEQLEQQSQFAKVIEEIPRLINSNRLDNGELGHALVLLGFAYQEQGEFMQARRAYERALPLLLDHQAPSAEFAAALESLADLYQDMGNVTLAIGMDRKALAIYERTQLRGAVARSCANLAGLELSEGHRKDGSKYLTRAIEEAKSAKDLDEDFFAAVSSTQAWLARLGGDTVEEVTGYQRAVQFWTQKHGDEHMLTGWGYMLLGAAQLRDGNDSVALNDMQRGLGILSRTVGSASPKYIVGELAYSRALDGTGSHEEAARLKQEAEGALADLNHLQCVNCSISVAAFQ